MAFFTGHLFLIYQRMVVSSSRAILKSLTRRLDALVEFRRAEVKAAEQKPERAGEDTLANLEELAPEEQLKRLESMAAAREYADSLEELEPFSGQFNAPFR